MPKARPTPTPAPVALTAMGTSAPDLEAMLADFYHRSLAGKYERDLIRDMDFGGMAEAKLIPEDWGLKMHFEIEKRIDPLTNRELLAPKFDLNNPREALKALSGSMELKILEF